MNPRSPALLCAALLALSPTAAAQTAPATTPTTPTTPAAALEAEHLRGLELRRQRRDAEARDLFRDLYARTQEPRALARQAAAEAALGEWVAAEEHLARALENASDPWITQHRAELDGDLAGFRTHVGQLEVICATPGAEAFVAGARVALPMARPVRVRAGTVSVEVRAEGYLPEVRSVTVAEGGSGFARETVTLSRQTTVAPVVVAGAPGVAPGVAPVAPVAPPPSGGITPLRIVGVSLLGVGVVGLGLGIYGVVQSSSLRTNYNELGCGGATPPADCAGYSNGDTEFTLGVVGLAAGGALAVGGVVLLLLPQSSGRRSARRGVTVASGPGQVGLSLVGSF